MAARKLVNEVELDNGEGNMTEDGELCDNNQQRECEVEKGLKSGFKKGEKKKGVAEMSKGKENKKVEGNKASQRRQAGNEKGEDVAENKESEMEVGGNANKENEQENKEMGKEKGGSETEKKQTKEKQYKEKESGKIKKPRNAFNIFVIQQMETFRKENPTVKNPLKGIMEVWKSASDAEKAKFQALAEEDKERYKKEKEVQLKVPNNADWADLDGGDTASNKSKGEQIVPKSQKKSKGKRSARKEQEVPEAKKRAMMAEE